MLNSKFVAQLCKKYNVTLNRWQYVIFMKKIVLNYKSHQNLANVVIVHLSSKMKRSSSIPPRSFNTTFSLMDKHLLEKRDELTVIYFLILHRVEETTMLWINPKIWYETSLIRVKFRP